MEVERFKHRQLAPTVGPIVTIIRRIRRTNHQKSILRAYIKTKYASSPKMESAQLDVFTPSLRSTNSSSESRKIRGNLLFLFGLEDTREPAGRTAPLGVPIST
jgi:hypothetical protein